MSYADRVRAGVALLDDAVPGWHNQIDLSSLDLGDCRECVLGQLFGSFINGARRLCDEDDASVLGFEVNDDGDYDEEHGHDAAYQLLTRLWVFVIRRRRQSERA